MSYQTKTVKKPGFMFRAVVAWCIFNAILFATLYAIIYIARPWMTEWYVMAILVVAVVASEWVIMIETIAPVIRDWIRQEEEVSIADLPTRASWEKPIIKSTEDAKR